MSATSLAPSSSSVISGERSSTSKACTSHAVSRSSELLSCAKTALKIEKANQRAATTAASAAGSDGGSSTDNYNPFIKDMSVETLTLHNATAASAGSQQVVSLLEDGVVLLRAMDYGLKKLGGLVRRRGHTNDPTMEISALVQQLEQDFKELEAFCSQLVPRCSSSGGRRPSKQAKKHWELVATWFQQVASHQSVQLKEILKLRGTVLADQAQRRRLVQQQQQKQLSSSKSGGISQTSPKKPLNTSSRRPVVPSSASATPLFDSPLFTATQRTPTTSASNQRTQKSNGTRAVANHQHSLSTAYPSSNATSGGPAATSPAAVAASSRTSPYYSGGGYGGTAAAPPGQSAATSPYGYGGGGGGSYYGGGASYGGASGSQGGFGMRQRKAGGVSSSPNGVQQDQNQQQDATDTVQQQIQERQAKRETAQRLAESQQAERTLGELGTLFGKMSTLISEQGEVLEKVEDDVEAAFVDVIAGQEELTKLYGIKKGNRPLIIKTFAILNFLIVFMRFYKN